MSAALRTMNMYFLQCMRCLGCLWCPTAFGRRRPALTSLTAQARRGARLQEGMPVSARAKQAARLALRPITAHAGCRCERRQACQKPHAARSSTYELRPPPPPVRPRHSLSQECGLLHPREPMGAAHLRNHDGRWPALLVRVGGGGRCALPLGCRLPGRHTDPASTRATSCNSHACVHSTQCQPMHHLQLDTPAMALH